MNTDVTFHKVETLIAEEAANSIRANIQAIHFKVIVLQQTLGQVVADKTVHPKNQHARAAFNRRHRLAAKQCPGD
ncbi:hypothetical protein D3C75_1018060 [compost metagenome]